MRYADRRRVRPGRAAMAALAAAAALATSAAGSGDAAAAVKSVTITDPGIPLAGDLTLSGSVSGGTTSVVFAVDTSGSTGSPVGLDCDGSGAPGPSDDLNDDHSVGDTLDCEIGAVRAMARTLSASAAPSLVSLETFGGGADVHDLDPATPGTQALVPASSPGTTGSLLESAVMGLHRDQTGTVFDPAVSTALSTLSKAPPGDKFIILLTDGRGHADQSTVDALVASGARLRAFSVANADGCSADSDLSKLAVASGEVCRAVTSPGGLATALADAPPPTVNAVEVTIGGQSFPATVDLARGWRLALRIGAGDFTATARAFFNDGSNVTASRSFAVSSNDAAGLPDGTVQGAGARATDVSVRRPASTLSALPSVVRGRVGTLRTGKGPLSTPALQTAVVLLQGQGTRGGPWVTLGHAAVGGTGTFTLQRGATASTIHTLRVALLPFQVYASSVRPVPPAGISGCRIVRRGTAFRASCHTAAAKNHVVELLRSGHVVQRARVASGLAKVSGHGRASAYVLAVRASATSWYRLRL